MPPKKSPGQSSKGERKAPMPEIQQVTSAPGKGDRTDERRRSLQEQAFYLNVVEGKTCREIGDILKITKDSASRYIRAEAERRSSEIAADRERLKAESVAFYDEMAALGVELAKKSEGAFMQPLIKGLDSALKARERRDKILGLDAPTKVDIGLEGLVNALTAGDEAKPLA